MNRIKVRKLRWLLNNYLKRLESFKDNDVLDLYDDPEDINGVDYLSTHEGFLDLYSIGEDNEFNVKDAEQIHLRDIVKEIDEIVFFGDGEIHFNDSLIDDDEEDNDAYLLDLPDSDLAEISVEEVRSVKSLELLEKLNEIGRYNDFSNRQRRALEKEYRKKFIVDIEDVAYILKKLKACKYMYVDGYWKTKEFLKDYRLDNDDLKYIIQNIKVSDYVNSTRNINQNYGKVGDNLIIFQPRNVRTADGRNLGDFIVYVKIDIQDVETGETALLFSMHPAERENETHPYR